MMIHTVGCKGCWQIPIWVLAFMMAMRLIISPYWIWKRQKKENEELKKELENLKGIKPPELPKQKKHYSQKDKDRISEALFALSELSKVGENLISQAKTSIEIWNENIRNVLGNNLPAGSHKINAKMILDNINLFRESNNEFSQSWDAILDKYQAYLDEINDILHDYKKHDFEHFQKSANILADATVTIQKTYLKNNLQQNITTAKLIDEAAIHQFKAKTSEFEKWLKKWKSRIDEKRQLLSEEIN